MEDSDLSTPNKSFSEGQIDKCSDVNYRNSNGNYNNSARKIIKRTVLILFLLCCFLVTTVLIGTYFIISTSPDNLNDLADTLSILSSKIVDDEIRESYTDFELKENCEYVKIDTLPPHVGEAFIAFEDKGFYEHNGAEIKRITPTAVAYLFDSSVNVESNITQLVVRYLRASQRSVYQPKLREQYLAFQYEKNMTEIYGSKKAAKDKILEIYINISAMGAGYNGVQKGAEYYFNKDASELTISEVSVLVPLTHNPYKYNPIDSPEANREIQVVVLQNMLDQGYITEAEYTEAMNDDVYSRIADKNVN